MEKSFTARHKELAAIFSNHFELLVVMQPSYGRLHSPQIKSVQAWMTESRPSEARGWIICNRAETCRVEAFQKAYGHVRWQVLTCCVKRVWGGGGHLRVCRLQEKQRLVLPRGLFVSHSPARCMWLPRSRSPQLRSDWLMCRSDADDGRRPTQQRNSKCQCW